MCVCVCVCMSPGDSSHVWEDVTPEKLEALKLQYLTDGRWSHTHTHTHTHTPRRVSVCIQLHRGAHEGSVGWHRLRSVCLHPASIQAIGLWLNCECRYVCAGAGSKGGKSVGTGNKSVGLMSMGYGEGGLKLEDTFSRVANPNAKLVDSKAEPDNKQGKAAEQVCSSVHSPHRMYKQPCVPVQIHKPQP